MSMLQYIQINNENTADYYSFDDEEEDYEDDDGEHFNTDVLAVCLFNSNAKLYVCIGVCIQLKATHHLKIQSQLTQRHRFYWIHKELNVISPLNADSFVNSHFGITSSRVVARTFFPKVLLLFTQQLFNISTLCLSIVKNHSKS